MRRVIFHLDGDAFYVSVERVFDSRLRGKPVIVGGSPRGRNAVLSVSSEVRRSGVRPGMPASQARRLAPEAIWIRGDAGRYATASRMIRDLLERYSPCVETESLGQFYIDMTGCERLHGHPFDAARKMCGRLQEAMDLSVSIGMGSTRLVARVASGLAKPSGLLYVLPGCEAAFLAPIPVGVLPALETRDERRLQLMGIRTLGDLARLDAESLRPILGSGVAEIRAQAVGADRIAVASRPDRLVEQETVFDSEVVDAEVLGRSLGELVARCCRLCRQSGSQAGKVSLRLLYTDLRSMTGSSNLQPPSDLDLVVLNGARLLLKRLHTRRAAVRVLGLELSDLSSGQEAGWLFGAEVVQARRRFYAGLDAVRARFGFASVASGAVLAWKRSGREGDSDGGEP